MNGGIEEPVADAEALVGSLKEESLLVQRGKARELSVPSLSSVPSTVLQRKCTVMQGQAGSGWRTCCSPLQLAFTEAMLHGRRRYH